MKNFKKIMALIIAAVMIVSTMSVTAFAADTADRKISVSNLEKDDKVTFYKVLGWAPTTDIATEKGAVSGWYFEEPFATAFDANGDHGKAKLEAIINDNNVFMLTDELAGEIARVINSGDETDLAAVTYGPETADATTKTATHTFKNEPKDSTAKDGLYMAVVTPADHKYIYNPIFVHLDSSTNDNSFGATEESSYYENEGAAKKSEVPLDKTATSDKDYTDPSDNGDTAKPGDILDFKVTTAIPGYGDEFLTPVYNVSDTMNGLELQYDPAEIKVKVGGTDITGTNKYTITGDTKGYQIKFDSEYLKTLKVATNLIIEYKAKVLDGENVNVVKEKNTVELEFSHDPSTEDASHPGGEKKYKKDITNHYTFSIDANNLVQPDDSLIGKSGSELIKVGVDANGNPITSKKTFSEITKEKGQPGPLDGAVFELLDKDGKSFDPQKLATSDAAGRLNFTGLDAGVYYLEEVKAPAGYVKQSGKVKITISAEFDTKTVTEYYDQNGDWWDVGGEGRTAYTYDVKELKNYKVTYGDADASEYTFGHAHESKENEIKWSIDSSKEAPQSIVNTKGVELPSTGGMGTTLFYIIGAILVVGAGIVLVTRRRMSAN